MDEQDINVPSAGPIMGALGKLSENPINPSLSNLSFASGMLQPALGGFGQALGSGLAAQAKTLSDQEALKASYMPHVAQALVQAAQLQKMQMGLDILRNMQRPNVPQANQPIQSGQSGQAPQLSQVPNSSQGALSAQNAPQPNAGGGGLENMTPTQIGMIKGTLGMDLLPEWKMAKFGEQIAPGVFRLPNGQIQTPQGFAETTAAIKAAEVGATKSAENKQTLLPREYIDKNNNVIGGTIDEYINSAANKQPVPGAAPATYTPPQLVADAAQKNGVRPSLVSAVIKTESGGDPNAVSAKGATGLMQLMPDTAKQFGVDPKDPAQNVQGGAAYLKQLQDKYGSEPMALAAYNYGPGNVDKWIQSGANWKDLPQETRDYVSKVMMNDAMLNSPQALKNAGVPTDQNGRPQLMSPMEQKEMEFQQRLQNEPKIALATDLQKEAHKGNQDYMDKLNDTVRNESELMNRNNQILPLLDKFQSGGFDPEGRLHLANAIDTSVLPQDVKDTLGKWLANGSPTAGKVVENQLASAGIKTMLDTLDKEGKPNRAIFQALQDAQESVKSGNATLKQVFDLQKQLYNWHYNQQQTASQTMAAPTYNPLTFQADMSKLRHQQLEAATPGQTQTQPQAGQQQTTQPRKFTYLGSH